MAPKPINTNDMELHESEIAKPQPLRIIKRSQTVTGNSTYGTPFGGRGSSGSSRESQGSPTFGVDRPLTVRKKRQTRASIADLRSENSGSNRSNSRGTLAELVRDYHALNELLEDSDGTPKANRDLPRTISAGVFLKQELQRGSNDTDSDGFPIQVARQPQIYNQNRLPASPSKIAAPKILERRPSKSKNFFLRAIGVRNNDDQIKHIQRTDESSSKNTSIRRRLSRTKKNSDSGDGGLGLMSSNSIHSFVQDSLEVMDISTPSRITSCTETTYFPSTPPPTSPTAAYVLGPQITLTPELSTVETGACSLWVAIEIVGVLQRSDGYKSDDATRYSKDQALDNQSYGRLHSMRIELIPGAGCRLTELIGDLHTAKEITAGETRLIVAKMCLDKAEPPPRFKDTLSDNLISELENDLGHTISRYLTVRLTYKHSGFLHIKGSVGLGGGSHVTRLQTEAIAAIPRHNPESAWSPRTSQTMDTPLSSNPVIDLIETHLPPNQAREALRRMASGRPPIPLARRFQHLGGSSEETVKACNISAKAFAAVSTSPVQATSKMSKFTVDHRKLKSAPLATAYLAHPYGEKQDEEIDPARRIWTEMRRHSRGGRSHHHRTSISADHYYSFADDVDCSPGRISSAQTSVESPDSSEGGGTPPAVERERTRLMEVALKNKRSLGADTLRSIAPSVVHSMGGKKSTLGGLGLGFGRSLGWGNSWW